MHTAAARNGTFILCNIECDVVSPEVGEASISILGRRAGVGGIHRATVVCNSCEHVWLGRAGNGLTPSMSGAYINCPVCFAFGHFQPPVSGIATWQLAADRPQIGHAAQGPMSDCRAHAFIVAINRAIGPAHTFQHGCMFASQNGKALEVRLWDASRDRQVAVEAATALWETLTPASVATLLTTHGARYEMARPRSQMFGLFKEVCQVRRRSEGLDRLPIATCAEIALR